MKKWKIEGNENAHGIFEAITYIQSALISRHLLNLLLDGLIVLRVERVVHLLELYQGVAGGDLICSIKLRLLELLLLLGCGF